MQKGNIMLKRIRKIQDGVYTIKISDDVYSLVQHRGNTFYEFFDIFFTKPDEKKFLAIDLNNVDILMTRSCASSKLKDFFLRTEKKIIPNTRPPQEKYLSFTYMIMYNLAHGLQNKEPSASSLIQIKNIHNGSYEVLIPELNEEADLDSIYKYEFFGMVGNSEYLKSLLIKYVESGILWGRDKALSFPHVKPYQKAKPILHLFSDLLSTRNPPV